MKQKFVVDLQFGDSLYEEYFAVKEIKKGKTHDNRDYIDLLLADKTGEIMGKVWTDDLENCSVNVGEVAAINATVVEFREKQQLKISLARSVTDFSLADFLPATTKDIAELSAAIDAVIASLKNDSLISLLKAFFDDTDFREKFFRAPAAEKVHHAYLGGLAEHINEMLRLAETLVFDYPTLDRDLLMTGVILHDIGKVEELGVNFTIYRTIPGNLLGHIALGYGAVNTKIATIKNFPAELKDKVLHLILSHHGQLEFGSPVKPMLREAFALSYIDNLSAKVNTVNAVVEGTDGERDFSDFNYYLDAKIFLK